MTQEQKITRRPTEYLPDTITKEQAAYLLHTIWPKAPDAEIIKAAILCKQYGLNPLMRQVYLIEFGKDWAIVLGIKATRQIAQQALKKRDIRYSYADGPRVMTEKEQIKIRGTVDGDKIWAITVLQDNFGNNYPGYGFWPANKVPYGSDKGNDACNMAFIRSERNALDKLAPGELPDIETADDSYIVADYKLALQQGKEQFNEKVEKDIADYWPESPKPHDASPTAQGEASAPQAVETPTTADQDFDKMGKEREKIIAKPEAKGKSAKKRDVEIITTIEKLAKALKEDYNMSYQQMWDELNLSSWNDLRISPKEAYLKVAASRA